MLILCFLYKIVYPVNMHRISGGWYILVHGLCRTPKYIYRIPLRLKGSLQFFVQMKQVPYFSEISDAVCGGKRTLVSSVRMQIDYFAGSDHLLKDDKQKISGQDTKGYKINPDLITL